MLDRINREPALVTGLAAAIIVLLVQFGVPITDGQQAAINSVVVIIAAIVIRGQVTPTTDVTAYKTSDGDTVAGPASPIPDGEPVAVVQDDYVGEHRGTEEEPPITGTTL